MSPSAGGLSGALYVTTNHQVSQHEAGGSTGITVWVQVLFMLLEVPMHCVSLEWHRHKVRGSQFYYIIHT